MNMTLGSSGWNVSFTDCIFMYLSYYLGALQSILKHADIWQGSGTVILNWTKWEQLKLDCLVTNEPGLENSFCWLWILWSFLYSHYYLFQMSEDNIKDHILNFLKDGCDEIYLPSGGRGDWNAVMSQKSWGALLLLT